MKQYFDEEIKPLNDELGMKLGNQISITQIPSEQTVKVKLKVKTGQTTTMEMSKSELDFYRALGLNI